MRKAIIVILAVVLFGFGGYSLYLYLGEQETEQEAFARQQEEADLADAYLHDIAGRVDEQESYLADENAEEEELETLPGTGEIEDNNYYQRDGVTYTPDYAKGEIECVLTVPTAGIHRGVYTGTWEEIAYDLDIWMVTAARPDYELGKTHYVIYGHNHTTQDLSFNNLAKVQVGDEFTLTSEKGVYLYRVANVYAQWRETATASIVDNFDLPKENCYIFTCGRNENRYKDLIVEGHLEKHMTTVEWEELQEQQELEAEKGSETEAAESLAADRELLDGADPALQQEQQYRKTLYLAVAVICAAAVVGISVVGIAMAIRKKKENTKM